MFPRIVLALWSVHTITKIRPHFVCRMAVQAATQAVGLSLVRGLACTEKESDKGHASMARAVGCRSMGLLACEVAGWMAGKGASYLA